MAVQPQSPYWEQLLERVMAAPELGDGVAELLAESPDLLPVLSESLSLQLVHRLESQSAVPARCQLGERRGEHEAPVS